MPIYGPNTLGLPIDPVIFAVLQARLEINVPPDGYDPRGATDAELETFFLPPRPNAVQTPVAFAAWQEAMSPPLSFLKPPPRLEDMFTTVAPRLSHMRVSNARQAQESSRNWSGGFVRPRDFGRIKQVHGAWTVPAPVAPAGAGDGTYASSIWVGIDGHDPASRSMPQIGTGQYLDIVGGVAQPDLFAWWQWWDRDDPGAVQVVIKNFVVKAGDVVVGHVHVKNPALVSFFLKNRSSGLSLPFHYKAPPPASTGTGTNVQPIRVEGRTAEWIVERPVDPDTRQYFPLVNYADATFTECNAMAGGNVVSYDVALQRARLIAMNVWDHPARPGVLVSSPQRNGKDSLKVDFVG